MTASVDWRDMFRRYADVVGREEGVDFLWAHDWTETEWLAIQALTETPASAPREVKRRSGLRLRLRLRTPWYTPSPPAPALPFELEMTVPDGALEVHMLAGDSLTMTFGESKTVHRVELTAPRQVALRPGDGLTLRGQVEGIDCHFTREKAT